MKNLERKMMNLTQELIQRDQIIFDFMKKKEIIKDNRWFYTSEVAKIRGLTTDAIRKQLHNGDFEEGTDFKYNGSRIKINQGAVERIQRRRRSSNG